MPRKKQDLARLAIEERGGGIKGKSLSYEQLSMVIKLSVAGKTQVEIADIIGCTQPTISRVLSEFTDTTGIAKIRLKGAAELMAERVIQASGVAASRGDASPALEVLDRIDALPKRQTGSKEGGTKVVVVVGSVTPPTFSVETVDAPALTSSTIAVD